MATENVTSTVTGADLRRVGLILNSIAENCIAIREHCVDVIHSGDDMHAAAHYAVTARELTALTGYLADYAASILGDSGIRGSAEEWLLKPLQKAGARDDEPQSPVGGAA